MNATVPGARGGAGASRRRLRALVALTAVSALVVVAAPPSPARPSKADLRSARARLAELRAARDRLLRRAAAARERLGAVAAEAYMHPGSDLELILTSRSLSDLSARFQFLGSAAQSIQDTAISADVKGEQAREAGREMASVLEEQRALLAKLDRQKEQIDARAAEVEAEIDRLEDALGRPVIVPLAPPTDDPAPTDPDPEPIPPPPPSGEGAAAAIAAAESVIGTPYQYGGSSPEEGFDCSGLTMWAWAHGGVSLPHSSQAQYDALPHVPRSELQPGDLVFFYNPIHHVGLYVGGGMMIDAPHTGTTVQRRPIFWDVYTGAARPG